MLEQGSTHTVLWTSNQPGDVRVVLWKASNFIEEVEAPVANNGSYVWMVPNDLPAGTDYQIRVRSLDNEAIGDFSDSFSILTSCPVAGTSCDDGNPDTINDEEDGIRDVERSRGLGDVYKRQIGNHPHIRTIVGNRSFNFFDKIGSLP